MHPPPGAVGEDFSGVTVCMHVRGHTVTTASMIAELPAGIESGVPLRAYVATGSPCVSVYVPAFPRTAAGPPPFVPPELTGEELWHAADALRVRVESDPVALADIRATLAPVEAELWAEADDVLGATGAAGRRTGRTWGSRALDALRSCGA